MAGAILNSYFPRFVCSMGEAPTESCTAKEVQHRFFDSAASTHPEKPKSQLFGCSWPADRYTLA
jgi:hypothetical protein